jgi:hypothetical protein
MPFVSRSTAPPGCSHPPPAVLIPGCFLWLLVALPDARAQMGGYQIVITATNQNFHPPLDLGTGRTTPASLTTPGSTGNVR